MDDHMKNNYGVTKDKNQMYYSPLMLGFLTLFMSYMGLALAEDPAMPFIPSWVWLSGLPLLFIGVLLQFLSKRVLWIRFYQTVLTLHMTLVFAFTIWSVEQRSTMQDSAWISLIIIGTVSLGCLISGYLSSINRAKKARMPHGAIGVLNFNTGKVDMTSTPKEIEADEKMTSEVTNLLLQWSPLFVGVLIALTRVWSIDSENLRAVIAGLMGLALGSLGLGSNVFYIGSIRKWEQQNERKIYVK